MKSVTQQPQGYQQQGYQPWGPQGYQQQQPPQQYQPPQSGQYNWDDSTEAGGGLPDDFDFCVTKAYFGYSSESQGGQTPLLIWEGFSPTVKISKPILWSIGNGWVPSPDQRT